MSKDNHKVLVPRVDIYEGKDGLILLADLPGVKDGDVDLHIEKNALALEAKATGLQGGPTWRRSFVLPRDIDTQGVAAKISAGVLEVKLPRRPEYQARRVEVKAQA